MDPERPDPQHTDRQRTDPARRRVVGGLATGLAAAALGTPAMAQQGGGSGAQGTAPGGQGGGQGGGSGASPPNPRTEHPRPPFPRQQQDWPGLSGRMDPVPVYTSDSQRGSGQLAGRRALITGGDSGIGRAAAIAFAREGADVAFNYLPAEEPDAQETVRRIREAGRKAVPLPGDIQDEGFCNRLVRDAVDQLGGLDILVNNAAYQQAVPAIADLSTEQFDQTFKTNVYAMFWITKAALPHMRPGSAIINTSSVVAYQPPEMLLDYSATKAAIVNFTQCLAKQLADKGIRVNSVAPGPFWTPLQVCGGQPPDNLPSFGADTPLGRPGQPVELAPIYVLLASAGASYSTGQVYGATGGRGGP